MISFSIKSSAWSSVLRININRNQIYPSIISWVVSILLLFWEAAGSLCCYDIASERERPASLVKNQFPIQGRRRFQVGSAIWIEMSTAQNLWTLHNILNLPPTFLQLKAEQLSDKQTQRHRLPCRLPCIGSVARRHSLRGPHDSDLSRNLLLLFSNKTWSQVRFVSRVTRTTLILQWLAASI